MKPQTFHYTPNSGDTMIRFHAPALQFHCFLICREGVLALAGRTSLVGLDSITFSRSPLKGSTLIKSDRNAKYAYLGSYWLHRGISWYVAGTLTTLLRDHLNLTRCYIRVNFTPSA